MKKLCIYHGNCADGFGAALAVKMALDDNSVDFFPGVYQDDPPDVTDREVILVDFSYKRDVLIKMASKAKSILILAHHKRAKANLVDLPGNVETHFDMERSCAVMAWEHFHPDEDIPQLFLHIQDRDLWEFKLHGTREILACLFSYPYDFDVWKDLLQSDLSNMFKDGIAINRKHFKDIKEYIKVAKHTNIIADFRVPALNAPYMWASDAADIMCKGEPFAVCYYDTSKGRMYSLRSNENGVDVSEIAAKYGGGGHKHAAGFRLGWGNKV